MRRCLVAMLAAGCGQRPAVEPATADGPAIRIVATERAPEGGLLVAISESGDRQGTLVAAAAGDQKVRDQAVAFSPDGTWVVFASSRGRSIDRSSLWVAPVGYDMTPFRLTTSDAIDLSPVWTPAGDAIVFASSRAGSFDLWRLPIAIDGGAVRMRGEPEQLTSAPGHELSPTVAADGRIAYGSLVVGEAAAGDFAGGGREATSRIEVRGTDGAIAILEPGPGDHTPRFDPTGERLAFARPTQRESVDAADGGPEEAFAAVDTNLWIREAGAARRVVDLPFTDESSPVWSVDGRWLFATSVVRKTNGEALLSSVIHVDLTESPPVARMLVDRAGAVTRLAPALAPVVLDAAALHADPPYVEELRRILRDAIERNENAGQR